MEGFTASNAPAVGPGWARLGGRPPLPAPAGAALRVTRRFDAPPQRVFDAWLDPATAGRWLFATATRPVAHVEIDARVAGTFRFAERHGPSPAVHTGRYLELAAPWRLAFSLILPGAPHAMTRVTVTLAARKTGCLLTLMHEGVPPAAAPALEARWTGILYGLGVMLDDEASAQERRLSRRAERRAAPKPARVPSGDRPTYSSDEGLS